MPGIIDPLTTHVDDLPGIWSPLPGELTPEERVAEIEEQAKASLLWAVSAPETILRLLLNECDIDRAFAPPEGFDTELQGEWDDELVTFAFKRSIKLLEVDRQANRLSLEYDFGDFGYWSFEIEPEKVTIQRI